MTQVRETTNFSLADHINAIEKHSYKGILDYVLMNTGKIPDNVAKRYAKYSSVPVIADKFFNKKIRIIKRDFVSKTQYAHHDFVKLAKAVYNIMVSR